MAAVRCSGCVTPASNPAHLRRQGADKGLQPLDFSPLQLQSVLSVFSVVKPNPKQEAPMPNRITGSLLGGALGDALGAPVEFLSLAEIRHRYGPAGITSLVLDPNGKALFTDDTQMTLFTAEGLLISARKKTGIIPTVHSAYIWWLYTQGIVNPAFEVNPAENRLLSVPELLHQRGPGNTCLSALRGSVVPTMDHPVNNSKGCGGVMRAAPVGLMASVEDPFLTACRLAAITHGHPSGYYPAGFLALLIRLIITGSDLLGAITESLSVLKNYPGHEETRDSITQALALSKNPRSHEQNISRLGQGWTGEEALAIALYCCLTHPGDFREAVIQSVNHNGDSDSTGSITGNIMGALLGQEQIPLDWQIQIECGDLLRQISGEIQLSWKDR